MKLSDLGANSFLSHFNQGWFLWTQGCKQNEIPHKSQSTSNVTVSHRSTIYKLSRSLLYPSSLRALKYPNYGWDFIVPLQLPASGGWSIWVLLTWPLGLFHVLVAAQRSKRTPWLSSPLETSHRDPLNETFLELADKTSSENQAKIHTGSNFHINWFHKWLWQSTST